MNLMQGTLNLYLLEDLRVNGEFNRETNFQVAGKEQPVTVSQFKTFLPSFQGEKLIEKLNERRI